MTTSYLFPSSGPVVAFHGRYPPLNPHGQPPLPAHVPRKKVSLEKEERVVSTILTPDSECSDDITMLHFCTLL